MSHVNKEDYHIEVTVGIRESILGYFSHSRGALQRFEEYAKCHREIDFLKMRRFFHTTYKTLNEIDSDFMAQKLTLLHDNVEMMAKVYDDFSSKSRMRLHSYEVIFLQQQENYVLYEGMLIRNVDELTTLRDQAERYKAIVNEQKDKLKHMSRFSGEYDKKSEDLKRLKRQENATIVRLGFKVEENAVMAETLKVFRETYEEQFLLMFDKYTKDLRPELLSILNAMAFELDMEMWLKASDSNKIRNHFKNSYADEVVSSKTYLRYYLKGLDQNKLNDEQKELQHLLEYLNQMTPTHCVLYMPSASDLHRFQSVLEADKSGFVIHAYTDAKIALSQAFKTRINILVLDLDIEENVLENFLSLYRKNSKPLIDKARIMLISSEVNDATIARAQMLGVDSLIERAVEPYEIIETVYDLLKIDNAQEDKV